MNAIYKLYNMRAIYLSALSIEYMLAIYYNKTIAKRTASATDGLRTDQVFPLYLACSLNKDRRQTP